MERGDGHGEGQPVEREEPLVVQCHRDGAKVPERNVDANLELAEEGGAADGAAAGAAAEESHFVCGEHATRPEDRKTSTAQEKPTCAGAALGLLRGPLRGLVTVRMGLVKMCSVCMYRIQFGSCIPILVGATAGLQYLVQYSISNGSTKR